MDIKIKKIKIENFKKVKQFELELENANVNIYGDNETGKTTLADAFTWCLFGKNSQWLSDTNFKIRPLDKNGEPIHYVDIIVGLTLIVDNKELVLKRVLKEKYKKSRNSNDVEFAGNETEFFVNDVPKVKKEYQEIIDGLISEELFKALTSPIYFNSSIDWNERRKTLFKLVADKGNWQDILSANSKLKILEKEFDILNSEEEIKSKWSAIKNQTEKDLEEIPTRIDELLKIDYSEVENLKNDLALKSKLVTIHNKIYDLKNATKDEKMLKLRVDLKDETYIIQDKIKSIKALAEEENKNFSRQQEQEIRNARETDNIAINAKTKLERELETVEYDLSKTDSRLNELVGTKAKLLEEYKKIKARELDFNQTKCFNCGQDLPKEKLDEVLEKFNETKAKDLEVNIAKGKSVSQEIEDLNLNNTMLLEKVSLIDAELEKINASHEPIEAIIESIKASYQNKIEENSKTLEEKLKPLTNELESLNIRIANLTSEDKENANEGEIEALEAELEEVNRLISKFAEYANRKVRIEELQSEEKQLLIKLENANSILNAIYLFTEIKANKIEEEINKHFEIVSFKLFNKNLNGSIENTCVATVGGVPFNDLNHAMQINAGLDIIKTLQKIYNIKAPIWIDNAEAITNFVKIDSQTIKLYVKENAKKLHFETEEEIEEEPASSITLEEPKSAYFKSLDNLKLEDEAIKEEHIEECETELQEIEQEEESKINNYEQQKLF
jgi:DNA repair protein SbcC/Rad50